MAGIEQILQSLSIRLGASHRLPSNSNTHSTPNTEIITNSGATENPAAFEGNTTTHAHSIFAREVLQKAVESSPMAGRNQELQTALTSLQNIVGRLSVQASTHESISPFPFSQGASISSLKDLQLPPQKYVKELIRSTFVNESVTFTKFFPFLDKSDFIRLCEDVFTSDGACSQARLVQFYGGLYWLFYEYSTMQTNHTRVASFDQYATLCRQNLEIVLSSLVLLMPATLENTQALLLGVSIECHHLFLVTDICSPECVRCGGIETHTVLELEFNSSELLSSTWIPPKRVHEE